MNKNLSISLFSIPTKAVFLLSTILTLLLYGACSSGKNPETLQILQQTYTVTFNPNANFSPIGSITVSSGNRVDKPRDPAPPNRFFSFGGWFTDNETFNEKYNFNTPINFDLTLYAKWDYMLTYDVATRTVTGLNPDYTSSNQGIDLVIPSEINGVAMDSIGYRAFYSKTRIKSLRIAYGIKHIGKEAFRRCSGFAGDFLQIPHSVVTIGDGAFAFCRLETSSLSIGWSVKTIGDSAFYSSFDIGRFTMLTLGSSIETIGNDAFWGCRDLRESNFDGRLFIYSSVKTIGDRAFYNCSGFTGSLTIPDGVETIGAEAFRGCNGFTGSLTIGNSVVTIGDGAFRGCSGFTGGLNMPNSLVTIGNDAFRDCWHFTGDFFTGDLRIPNSVKTIGERAFSGCRGFDGSLTLPNSVETIEEEAFSGCRSFTGNLTIPNSVVTIGARAFKGMTGIDSFVFENSTPPTSIGENIFQSITLANLDIIVPDAGAVTAYMGVANLSPYSTRIRVAR